MHPVTAIGIIAAGFALVLLSNPVGTRLRKTAARILATTAAAIGCARLVAILFRVDLHFFNFPTTYGPTETIVYRTALNLLLTGAALLLLDVRRRGVARLSQLLAALSALIAVLGLVAYSYDLIGYYMTPTYVPTSLPGVLAFLLLATGILLARSENGTMRIIASDTAGGLLARRLIPLAIVLPLLLGTLRLLGENAGLYSSKFGAAHAATATMTVFFGAVWWTARLLHRADEKRKAAELARDKNAEHIRILNMELEERVAARTAELHEVNEELRRASKAKDDFLAVLSHELRTPLTPALVAATHLAENQTLPAELRDDLFSIRRNVQLEARLIDDLLDLTRITRGKIELRREVIDAHSLLQKTLQILDEDIRHKQLRLSLRFDAARHHVSADPIRLQQIFWNVINNAVKFTAAEGSIEISSANDNWTLIITIKDDGAGIDPASQPHIFDAFEQGESSTGRQFGGLGLGLAISKNLIDLHGGQISAKSDGLGQGATFTISLPCVELTTISKSRKTAPQSPVANGLRVLLVEDHADTLRILSRILSRDGFQVRTAGTVAEATRLLSSQSFDALVTDIGLPDGNGCELMRTANAMRPLRGIAISGFGMEEDIKRSKEAGFEHHLTKPIDALQLETLLVSN